MRQFVMTMIALTACAATWLRHKLRSTPHAPRRLQARPLSMHWGARPGEGMCGASGVAVTKIGSIARGSTDRISGFRGISVSWERCMQTGWWEGQGMHR
jgi:hypothetical protein